MKLRWYQGEAVDALINYLFSNEPGHPIVVAPTGSGKTAIMCGFADEFLSKKIDSNILVLSHVQEILEQDYDSLSNYFDGFEIGLFSSGLQSKIIKKITVAGIQSVYRHPELFQDFNIVLIDECHTVTIKETGMYRKFLSSLDANYVGLTATPFRLGHGYINKGEGALFTDIVYDLSSKENFNRLVNEGYLARLIPKSTEMEMDVSGVRTVAGDYSLKDLSQKFDREEITKQAVDEIIKYGKNYKKWLIFSIDIDHAEHIASYLNEKGIRTCCVHSKMEQDREQVISDYKRSYYRAAVNVDIMTTGLDVKGIDLIAQLRHTKSPVVHVQSFGRGSRVIYADGYDLDTIDGRIAAIEASEKTHCLILDFAGNTEKLGPINDIVIKQKGDKKTGGEPVVKTCPECGVYHPPAVRICDVCGYEFEFKTNLNAKASGADIIKETIVGWVDVDNVEYDIHPGKGNKPDSFLVKYVCGLRVFKEWICYDHTGFAGHKGRHWVRYRLNGSTMPSDVYELAQWSDQLRKPKSIKVDTTDKFPRILDAEF